MRAAILMLLFLTPPPPRDFSGLFTPEYVERQNPPFIPVSARARIEVGARVSGDLHFREMGSYRLAGGLDNGKIRLSLYDELNRVAGNAVGRLEGSLLEMELILLDSDSRIRSRGRLALEAAVEWRASRVLKGRKLQDRARRPWFVWEFDDSTWETIALPDDNAFGDEIKRARYYRSRFVVNDPADSLSVVFSSDDGIWIYVNGRYLGHWGAEENQGGCVNDPLGRCGVNGTVSPVVIPSEFLKAGDNVIAVRVNNGECCFTYFNLLVMRVSARFSPAR